MTQPPAANTATVAPPPPEDQTVQHIVEILLAGYAINRTCAMLNAILPGIPVAIWRHIIGQTGGLRGYSRHSRLDVAQFREIGTPRDVAQAAVHRELYYRAAYLRNAAQRVTDDVREQRRIEQGAHTDAYDEPDDATARARRGHHDTGSGSDDELNDDGPAGSLYRQTLDAVRREQSNFQAHETARRGRLDAAAAVARSAAMFGDLLGWYHNPAIANEATCLAASGNNFYAHESTIIGDPGAVHPHCGCVPGPPHATGRLVNAVLASTGAVASAGQRRYGVRRKAG